MTRIEFTFLPLSSILQLKFHGVFELTWMNGLGLMDWKVRMVI